MRSFKEKLHLRYLVFLILFIGAFLIAFKIHDTVAYFVGVFGFYVAYYFGDNYDKHGKV